MRRNSFLRKLRTEGKIELVEPSGEICESYSRKSADCLQSAKLLLQNKLFENSIGMSYYAMYNSLLALLFRMGVKSENHAGSILLLLLAFGEKELSGIISDAKKERIDRQYYVLTEKEEITKEIAEELFHDAEDFALKMKALLKRLGTDGIEDARKNFSILVD
ncbi:HEPN domain-containing protein [Candidatus Woesearchaeota archaeon]|nr:HEPN domain-containing protein [Candidatus Woesearchaeota archaeon]